VADSIQKIPPRSPFGCSLFISSAVASGSVQVMTSKYKNRSVDPMAFDIGPNSIETESRLSLGTKLPGSVAIFSIGASLWACRKIPPPPPPPGPIVESVPPPAAAPEGISEGTKRNILAGVVLGSLLILVGATIMASDGPLPFMKIAGAPVVAAGAALMVREEKGGSDFY